MKHLFEILKIVDSAINGDRQSVIAYTDQLAQKLEEEGDKKCADRIKKVTNGPKVKKLNLSRTNQIAQLPVDSESRLSLADEKYFDLEDVHVIVNEQLNEKIEEFCNFVKHADNLISEGVGLSPSLLLYGPPGCGKTETAHYISAKLNLPIITARSDSLISSYLGSTAKNIRMLFEHVSKRPCVLFLDEFDAIAKLRDDKHELGELKRVVISLLQNLDALDSKTIVIAATNHEHLLDSAIWRRFSFQLSVNQPNKTIRKEMFQSFLGNYGDEKISTTLSVLSEGLSGAIIKEVCLNAKRKAIINDKKQCDLIDLTKQTLDVIDRSIFNSELPLEERISKCKEINNKIFTIRLLAQIFDISTGKVSNLLKQGGI